MLCHAGQRLSHKLGLVVPEDRLGQPSKGGCRAGNAADLKPVERDVMNRIGAWFVDQ